MTRPFRWSRVTEVVGTLAVVLSLVYVGVQVRQNTNAIQTSTSQSVYAQCPESAARAMESPELAQLLIRADSAPKSLSTADSLKYDYWLNLQINIYEVVYTNVAQGTMEPGMATGWLYGLHRICRDAGRAYWNANGKAYAPIVRVAMTSVMANAPCRT